MQHATLKLLISLGQFLKANANNQMMSDSEIKQTSRMLH